MDIQESINLLDQVCQNYRGTRQEHVALQQAMQTVRELAQQSQAEKQTQKEARVEE